MKVKKMPGKVTNIAKIFEMQQSATKPVAGPEHRLNKDNNTSLLQSVWLRSAQPMAHQHGGQVTTYSGAEPITAQMTRTDQNSMGDSHIVPGETNWRPKVTGHFDWEV